MLITDSRRADGRGVLARTAQTLVADLRRCSQCGRRGTAKVTSTHPVGGMPNRRHAVTVNYQGVCERCAAGQ